MEAWQQTWLDARYTVCDETLLVLGDPSVRIRLRTVLAYGIPLALWCAWAIFMVNMPWWGPLAMLGAAGILSELAARATGEYPARLFVVEKNALVIGYARFIGPARLVRLELPHVANVWRDYLWKGDHSLLIITDRGVRHPIRFVEGRRHTRPVFSILLNRSSAWFPDQEPAAVSSLIDATSSVLKERGLPVQEFPRSSRVPFLWLFK